MTGIVRPKTVRACGQSQQTEKTLYPGIGCGASIRLEAPRRKSSVSCVCSRRAPFRGHVWCVRVRSQAVQVRFAVAQAGHGAGGLVGCGRRRGCWRGCIGGCALGSWRGLCEQHWRREDRHCGECSGEEPGNDEAPGGCPHLVPPGRRRCHIESAKQSRSARCLRQQTNGATRTATRSGRAEG